MLGQKLFDNLRGFWTSFISGHYQNTEPGLAYKAPNFAIDCLQPFSTGSSSAHGNKPSRAGKFHLVPH